MSQDVIMSFLSCLGVPNITVVVNGDPAVNNIMLGSSFTITCQPSCPTALLSWIKDGSIISNGSSTAVTVDGFSIKYFTGTSGLVSRSVLSRNVSVLNDSATYQCISTVQGIETTANITISIYGKHLVIII